MYWFRTDAYHICYMNISDEFGIQYDDFAELSLHMKTKEEMFDFLTAVVEQRRK